MKAYYETVIRTSKGKTTPIAYVGEWDGKKFIGTDESGFEIIVRKKEWVTIVNETQEQEIKELRELLDWLYNKDDGNNPEIEKRIEQALKKEQ